MTQPPARRIQNPFRESIRVLGLYIRGQFLITGLTAVLYAAGFAIGHMPWWPLVAVLCGACYLVPRIGSLIALGLAALVSGLGDGNLMHLLIVFVTWVIVQGLEGFYLTPRILGRPLGLRPLAVFAALIVGSLFFGPVGFLLAVPVLAVLNVFWQWYRDRPRAPAR